MQFIGLISTVVVIYTRYKLWLDLLHLTTDMEDEAGKNSLRFYLDILLYCSLLHLPPLYVDHHRSSENDTLNIKTIHIKYHTQY